MRFSDFLNDGGFLREVLGRWRSGAIRDELPFS